MKFKIIY